MSMKNLLVEVSYRGTAYHGFQFQKNALSIAEVLQDKIEQVLRKREPIVGCSRTDAGVHANSCFFHMKTDVPFPTEKFPEVLNRVLPPDIVVLSCKEVSLDFHATPARERSIGIVSGIIRSKILFSRIWRCFTKSRLMWSC